MAIRACQQDDAKFASEPKVADPFEASRRKFEDVVAQLKAPAMRDATHSAVEELLSIEGREVLRLPTASNDGCRPLSAPPAMLAFRGGSVLIQPGQACPDCIRHEVASRCLDGRAQREARPMAGSWMVHLGPEMS